MKLKLISFRCKIINFIRRKRLYNKHLRVKSKELSLSHITYYACLNVGDTVLSDTVRNGFNGYFKSIKWNLFDVSEEINSEKIRKYNNTNALVIGGGGLFLPDTNDNSNSGWQWPISSDQLVEINSPIIIYSVGFNYFRGQNTNDLFIKSLIEIISRSSFVGLRNNGSIEEVKKLIPESLHKKIVYQPCLTTIIKKLDYQLRDRVVTKNIAFNVAYDRLEYRLGKKKEQILSEIALSMKKISERGYNLYYIAHIIKDLEFYEYMKKQKMNVTVVNASAWSSKKLIDFYNNMDLVAGMRGHAQMIPFGVNTHIITLGSHNKMKWFLDDINATDWYIELTQEENLCDKILDKFITIHEQNKEETDKKILQSQNYLYDITCKNFKTIDKIIKGDKNYV